MIEANEDPMSGNDPRYGHPSYRENEPTEQLFFDDEPGPPSPPEPGHRRFGFLRHLGSLLVALVLTPVALLLMDYAMTRRAPLPQTPTGEVPDAPVLATLLGACVLLFVVAAVSRVSPAGPIVAGVVWALAPWVLLTFFTDRAVRALDDLPYMYDDQGVNSFSYGFASYAVVAALLIGSGCAVAWRRR